VENFRELLVFGDRNPFLFHGPLVPSEHAVKPEMDEHSETRFVPPFHAAVAISDRRRGRPGVLRLCKQGCGRYRRNRGCRAEGAEQAASGNVNFAGHSFCCITIRKRVLAVIGTTSDYSYRSASVGFRLAARFAGSMPNPTPTDTEAAKAITMERDEIGILTLVSRLTLSGAAIPMRMPMNPPPTLLMMDSVRNCPRTSFLDDPTALRSPISRVRSVTVTSMMFIMPMPEMMRASAETTINTISRISAIDFAASRIADRFATLYRAPGR